MTQLLSEPLLPVRDVVIACVLDQHPAIVARRLPLQEVVMLWRRGLNSVVVVASVNWLALDTNKAWYRFAQLLLQVPLQLLVVRREVHDGLSCVQAAGRVRSIIAAALLG